MGFAVFNLNFPKISQIDYRRADKMISHNVLYFNAWLVKLAQSQTD